MLALREASGQGWYHCFRVLASMWAVAGEHRVSLSCVRPGSLKTAWATKGEGMVETLA
jgi:hypothetical protein